MRLPTDPQYYRFDRTSGLPHGYFDEGRRWWGMVVSIVAVFAFMALAWWWK